MSEVLAGGRGDGNGNGLGNNRGHWMGSEWLDGWVDGLYGVTSHFDMIVIFFFSPIGGREKHILFLCFLGRKFSSQVSSVTFT